MLKNTVISVVLLALVATTACEKSNDTSNNQQDNIELTEEETKAIEILNDEVIRDQCVVYADEDNIKDEDLKQYLDSCVEQLKAEATMIEPEDDTNNLEAMRKQCALYAEQDAIKKDKLDEYMDLCIEQLRTEVTIIETTDEEVTEEKIDAKEEKSEPEPKAIESRERKSRKTREHREEREEKKTEPETK